jgi:hypothetical protein
MLHDLVVRRLALGGDGLPFAHDLAFVADGSGRLSEALQEYEVLRRLDQQLAI